MRKSAVGLSVLGATLGLLALAVPAQAQATRTWVSGVGDDANPCSRTAPCKTFAGAISKTAANGIINCLDPGGFGAVTITKSITIDCKNTQAGILAAGTNGVTINASNIVVNLRGLSIEGVVTGLVGVNFVQGAVLVVEQCKIFGFNAGTATGIRFVPGTAAQLYITDTTVSFNGTGAVGGGIVIAPTGAVNVNASLTRVQVQNNSIGINANGATGTMRVSVKEGVIAGNGNAGIQLVGASLVRVDLDQTQSVSNGTGLLTNGAQAQAFINQSAFMKNSTGANVAAGTVFTYVNNTINGNTADLAGAALNNTAALR